MQTDAYIMLLQLCFTRRQAACIDTIVQREIYSCTGSKRLLERRVAKSIWRSAFSSFRAEQSCPKLAICPGAALFNSIQFSLFPAHINISYSNNNVYILCRKRGGQKTMLMDDYSSNPRLKWKLNKKSRLK